MAGHRLVGIPTRSLRAKTLKQKEAVRDETQGQESAHLVARQVHAKRCCAVWSIRWLSTGRIKTTLAKAKELRRHVERAVTMGKKGTLHAQRLLLARYPNDGTVSVLMKDLGPRFKDRPGGYTRILKIGARPGDKAQMAFIEWVDYVTKVPVESDQVAVEKAVRINARSAELKKKRVRKLQESARRTLRANA